MYDNSPEQINNIKEFLGDVIDNVLRNSIHLKVKKLSFEEWFNLNCGPDYFNYNKCILEMCWKAAQEEKQ